MPLFPNWTAITAANDSNLTKLIVEGTTDTRQRVALGWPELFTNEDPNTERISFTAFRHEFDTLHRQDRYSHEEILDILSRKLNFPLLTLYDSERRRKGLRGNFGVSAGDFNDFLRRRGGERWPIYGTGVFGNTVLIILRIDYTDRIIFVTPLDRFDLGA